MPQKIELKETLVKAVNLDQFRGENGTRRLNMPYWVNIAEDGEEPELFFEFISKDTDVNNLIELIDKGKVFIQEKYLKQ